MAASNTLVDGDRLWQDIMALADITEPGKPYTRRSFTPRFLAGRAYLIEQFKAAGLEVRIDTAGNLIGRRAGAKPHAKTIMMGSHSDTVPSGGRFDGIAGVVAALEVARALRDAGIELQHNLEVVDFLAEEPSEYGLSCVGSRGMSGQLTNAMLDFTGPQDERLGDALIRVGGNPAKLTEAVRKDIAAYLELHIEQGPVLEQSKTDLGLVTGIVGITRLEIAFQGAADHAGTTPMHMRRDALYAAAQAVTSIREQAEALASEPDGYFVATVGILTLEPGGANVVPEQAKVIVDIRTGKREKTLRFLEGIDAATQDAAAKASVERSHFKTLSDTMPMDCDLGLLDDLAKSADALGHSYLQLASGAGHDAAFIGQLAPAAMVFVPCLGGRSHTPEEWAEKHDIAAGAAAMFAAVRRFDERTPVTNQTHNSI